MKIHSVIIKDLFDIFNYSISFKENENVLIITGPNGYGKTKVLNILFHLFNRKFLYFQKLEFREIVIKLDNKSSIQIIKKPVDGKSVVSFVFLQDNKQMDTFDYSSKLETDLERIIQRYLPVRRVGPDRWLDIRTNKYLNKDDLINTYAEQLPEEVNVDLLKIDSSFVNGVLDSINVHLIKEQRLFKRAAIEDRNAREDMDQTIMTETIQTYSKELQLLISEFSQKSIAKTQDLDSSYPNRLINEKNILSKDDYEKRYKLLKIKQEKLTEFGLYESKQELLTYSQNDAKALSVYLKDLETKLNVFDDLLKKLELFSSILNERRFTFKSIHISRLKGFYFKTVNNKDLALNQLSSGEQHEVVLLYELIFNVKKNVLVLIDEPEISLHITWQKEFLNDLLKIIELEEVQVLIATHSPSIINSRWDLVYNLESTKVS